MFNTYNLQQINEISDRSISITRLNISLWRTSVTYQPPNIEGILIR